MTKRTLGSVLLTLMLAGATAQAHHSTAAVYDSSLEGEVTGTLAAIKFVNPHGTLTITVTNDDGSTTDWVFTTGSATALAGRGITKVGPNALKVGEELTVTYQPARNGAPLGGFLTATRADGTTLRNSGGN